MSELAVGRAIGKYEVRALVGRGAMASVYRVRHTQLDATYALKLLAMARPEITERLINEGRVQASLRHPNVVGVNDVILVDGRPALVLEYVDGPDLEAFLRKNAPLPLTEVDDIARGILRGVRAAHRAGHLHRDLKPTNILLAWLDDAWVPKVADFGLARVLYAADERVSSTRAGQIMGSPPFMSPEQCRDSSTVDERSDVFALGAVLYELATGHRAFAAEDLASIFARIAAGAYVPVDRVRPDLPRRMVDAIHGALAPDRDDRVPDVDTLLRVWSGEQAFDVVLPDVERSIASLVGRSPVVRTPHTLDRARSSPSIIRPAAVVGSMASLLALLGLLGGAVLGGLMVAVWYWVTAPSPPPPEPTEPPRLAVGKVVAPTPDVAPDPLPEPAPEPAPEPPPALEPRVAPAPRVPEAAPRPAPVEPIGKASPVWGGPSGRFRVVGDASVVLIHSDGTSYRSDEAIPPGTYWISALFHGDPRSTVLRGTHVDITDGKAVVLTCTAMSKTCDVTTE